MIYATVEEMALLRPGGIDAPDQWRAGALLEEASALVDECAGSAAVAAWSFEGAAVPRAVKSVTIQVALRVFDNPTGLSMEQATGYTYMRPQSHVTGLELTRSERIRIRACAGRASISSVRTPVVVDEAVISTVLATDTI